MPRIAILIAALLVCAPLVAADFVTSEVPLQPFVMPDSNTHCSVRADDATAYAICTTYGGLPYRIDLDADGRPLLATRRPYTPPGGTYVNIVAAGETYYVVVSGGTLVVHRSGRNAEVRVDGSAPLLTWDGGSRLLLTYSSGSKTFGMLLNLSLETVVAPFAILPATPYRTAAGSSGNFMVATYADDRTTAAAVVAPDGSVRTVTLPFDRYETHIVLGNGTDFVFLSRRAQMPLDTPATLVPVMAQRYTTSGDATGNAITISNDRPGALSIVPYGNDYLIAWSNAYRKAFLLTFGGAAQPLVDGDPWLYAGPAGLFLTTSNNGQPTTIRRLDTNGPTNILAYGYISEYVSSVAYAGKQTAVVWNEGTDIRIGRFAPDGTSLDGPGVVLPIDHKYVLHPSIAFDGVNYLLAWWGSDAKIKGLFFGRDGKLASDPFVISDEKPATGGNTPGITWTGANYLLTWPSSYFGLGTGAVVTPSGGVTPFRFANGVAMTSVAAGPRNLVVYLDYSESYMAKVAGVFLDAASDPFELEREWGTQYILLEPRVATNGHDYLVTWQRQQFYRRTEAIVARLDDRGHFIGQPFVAAASETPAGARAIPLFDGNDYRVVVSGDPNLPLFTAHVDAATIACGCFADRTAIPIDFDLASSAQPIVAAASPDGMVVAYGRPFTNDATYGWVPRTFLRVIRPPQPPRHRPAGK